MRRTVPRRSIGVFLAICACNGGSSGGGDNETAGETGTATAPMTSAAVDESSGGAVDDSTGMADTGEPAEICDGLEFDNVIDEAACPKIQGIGVEPPPADGVEQQVSAR